MRAILLVGGAFVLAAGVQLFLLAERTDRFFAWTIEPPLTAAFLGAFYWGAAVLAFLSARERLWARARVGLPGVTLFVSLTLAATLIHLDRFHTGSDDAVTLVATWAWILIYAIEPPLLVAVFLMQLRAGGQDPPRERPMPSPLRALVQGLAVWTLGAGVVLFVAPETGADLWPWPLTPLTARASAAWLVGVGALLAAAAKEDDLIRTRWAMVSAVVMSLLQLAAVLRFGGDAGGWGVRMAVYLATVVALGVAGVWGLVLVRRPLR